jgi:hypothetical protein
MKESTARISIALILTFISASSVFGLDMRAGIKAGLTSPWFSGPGYQAFLDTPPPFHSVLKIGLSAGAFLTIGVSEFLAIQPEVFFSTLGGRADGDSATWNESANGFDLQALLKWSIRTHGSTIIAIFGGPDLYVKIGNEKATINGIFDMTYNDIFLNALRFGITCGLGLEFPMNAFFWTIDLRYTSSFTPRFTEASGLGQWYQNSFQILFGLGWYSVGKKVTNVK